MAWEDIFSGIGNFIGNGLSNPSAIPAWATAYQQWKQAGQYQNDAERYAQQLDPFGGQRAQYHPMLAQTFNDPSGWLNNPAYTKYRDLKLENVMRKGGAQGYANSGNILKDLTDYQSAMDWEQINKDREMLGNLGGAQFGPQAAGDMLKTGLLGKMGAQNAALGALMYPFGRGQGADSSGQGGLNWLKSLFGGGQGSGTGLGNLGGMMSALKGLVNPNDFQEILKAVGPGGIPGGMQGLWGAIMDNPNISESTKNILEQVGMGEGGGGFNFGGGGGFSQYSGPYSGLTSGMNDDPFGNIFNFNDYTTDFENFFNFDDWLSNIDLFGYSYGL